MEEKEIVENLLLCVKGECDLMMHGAIESSTPNVHAAATDGELRAVAAERRIENLYKVIYMEGRIGEIFTARVSSVSSFGVFAMLENTCEGLIPLSSMTGVFTYDEKRHRLVSRHRTYAVGDELEVRLTEADRIRGKLAFSDIRDEGAWEADE